MVSSVTYGDYISSLPRDMLVEILRDFTPKELVIISMVSRIFRQISNDPFLWKIRAKKMRMTLLANADPKLQVTNEIVQRKLNSKIFEEHPEDLLKNILASPQLLLQVDVNGNMPLHHFMRWGLIYGQMEFVQHGRDLFLKKMLSLNHDPNKQNCRGQTALHVVGYYASNHFTGPLLRTMIDWCIEKGYDFDTPDDNGRSALFYLANFGRSSRDVIDIIEFLASIGKPFNLKAKDKFGLPALFYALSENRLDLARYLFSKGVSLDFLHMSSSELSLVPPFDNPHESLEKMTEKFSLENLIDCSAPVSERMLKDSFLKLRKEVNRHRVFGADNLLCDLISRTPKHLMNLQDDNGASLAHFAAAYDAPKALKLLASKGAELDIKCSNTRPSPMGIAIFGDCGDSFMALRNLGVSIQLSNYPDFDLLLHLATYGQNIYITDECLKESSLKFTEKVEQALKVELPGFESLNLVGKLERIASKYGNRALCVALMRRGYFMDGFRAES